ncbi:unnamed protein product [Strongylus vulgaris]|uniref:Uncharacterized protein n=1 Tax=Strongylus vulgaris TaxID=40348 RepID=A0A3P7IL16_STRVU|nr:unnamed protein product [Strongylus vulgaris]
MVLLTGHLSGTIQQWFRIHLIRAKVLSNRKLEKKTCHIGGRKEVLHDGVRSQKLLTTCDGSIKEDPTMDYGMLFRELSACAKSASLSRIRNLERISKATKDLLRRRRALRLDPTASHLK